MKQGTDEYREHMRVYMLNRYHERRNEAIQLLGGVCAVCGTDENLEIDHVDRSLKTMNVNRMAYVSRERFLEELENCQLLCKEDHIEKTRKEMSVPHGGGAAGKKNCMCDLCKVKRSAYMKKYKEGRTGRTVSPRTPPLERLKGLHGTRAGYLIEVRFKIPRCDACKAANTAYTENLKSRSTLDTMSIKLVHGSAAASISRVLGAAGVPSYSTTNCDSYVSVSTSAPAQVKKALDTMGYVYTYRSPRGNVTTFRVTGKHTLK